MGALLVLGPRFCSLQRLRALSEQQEERRVPSLEAAVPSAVALMAVCERRCFCGSGRGRLLQASSHGELLRRRQPETRTLAVVGTQREEAAGERSPSP